MLPTASVSKFRRAQASADPRLRGNSLQMFLIRPVQRVPRYCLLLDAVLKRTPPDDPDRGDLEQAAALVGEAAGHNDAALGTDENHAALARLQLTIYDPSGRLNLLDWPGRRIVRGPLEMSKLCRRGPKVFTFWLLSDTLVYAQKILAPARRGSQTGASEKLGEAARARRAEN